MARSVRLWVSDDAVVEVTSGEEYGDREVTNVSQAAANRVELQERVGDGLVTLQGHIDDIDAELTAWPGYDAAGVKASLQDEILPALRFSMVAVRYLARLVVGDTSSVD